MTDARRDDVWIEVERRRVRHLWRITAGPLILEGFAWTHRGARLRAFAMVGAMKGGAQLKTSVGVNGESTAQPQQPPFLTRLGMFLEAVS